MPDAGNNDDFVVLYASAQRRIYAFVRSQVRSAADADDVLQDTAAVLWRKFSQFQPDTDFVRWACRIARYEVLTHHRHEKRLLSIFSNEVADAVAQRVLDLSESAAARTASLDDCVELLSDRDRDLLKLKYEASRSIKEIALAAHCSESSIYKSLARVHDNLFDCIETKMRERIEP